MPAPAIDMSKFSFDDFCKALYGCKTAADVAALVKQDYGHELPRTKDREAMLRAAYEIVCKGKAPEPQPLLPPPPAVPGRFRVRVVHPDIEGRNRAGLRFTRRFTEHDLTAAQAAEIEADKCLQIQPVS